MNGDGVAEANFNAIPKAVGDPAEIAVSKKPKDAVSRQCEFLKNNLAG